MDLRVQKTYASLTAAFEELLKEKDFDKISVNELCERALIRRPTFYKHFLDKYDFLSFFFKERINTLFDKALEFKSDQTPIDFHIRLFELFLDETDQVENMIFKFQLDTNFFTEIKSIHHYGEQLINDYVQIDGEQLDQKYKSDLILGITMQSAFWYLRNKNLISKKDMVKKFKKMIILFF